MAALRVVGQSIGGLGILAYLVGRGAWQWLSGAAWTRRPRRRYVTRPVRATLQSGATGIAVGLYLAPAATATVLAALGAALVGGAGWLRWRERHARRVHVTFGRPIRQRRPIDTPGKPAVEGSAMTAKV